MRCKEIIARIEKRFPPVYAQEWDNVGLLVGHYNQEVRSVLFALDATDEVIEEAVSKGVQMLITHHPMIFKGIGQINDRNFVGKKILRLAENKIACYAMHTNFDVMGMAQALADLLQLTEQEVLVEVQPAAVDGKKDHNSDTVQGIGRIGYFEKEMTLRECARFVKEQLQLPFLTVSGNPDSIVHHAAVSSGSGKSVIADALKKGADVLITGDIGHHEALDAKEQHLCIIDAGHYGTEKLFADYMERWFMDELPGVVCYQAAQGEPFFVL